MQFINVPIEVEKPPVGTVAITIAITILAAHKLARLKVVQKLQQNAALTTIIRAALKSCCEPRPLSPRGSVAGIEIIQLDHHLVRAGLDLGMSDKDNQGRHKE